MIDERATSLPPKIAPTSSMASSRIVLQVKKLSDAAILPTRGSPGAAGYDLCSAVDGVVPARGKALLKTDLAVAVPSGCYGRVGACGERREGQAFGLLVSWGCSKRFVLGGQPYLPPSLQHLALAWPGRTQLMSARASLTRTTAGMWASFSLTTVTRTSKVCGGEVASEWGGRQRAGIDACPRQPACIRRWHKRMTPPPHTHTPTHHPPVKAGDRIAQMVLERIAIADSVEEVAELDDTVRGAGGFGSTGVSGTVAEAKKPRTE